MKYTVYISLIPTEKDGRFKLGNSGEFKEEILNREAGKGH